MFGRRLVFLVCGRGGGLSTISIAIRRFVVPIVRGAIAPVVVLAPVGILSPVISPAEFVLPFAFVALSLVALVVSLPLVLVFAFQVRISRFEGFGGATFAADFALDASVLLLQEVGDFLFAGAQFRQFVGAGTDFRVVSHGDGRIFRNWKVEDSAQMGRAHGYFAENFPSRS